MKQRLALMVALLGLILAAGVHLDGLGAPHATALQQVTASSPTPLYED